MFFDQNTTPAVVELSWPPIRCCAVFNLSAQPHSPGLLSPFAWLERCATTALVMCEYGIDHTCCKHIFFMHQPMAIVAKSAAQVFRTYLAMSRTQLGRQLPTSTQPARCCPPSFEPDSDFEPSEPDADSSLIDARFIQGIPISSIVGKSVGGLATSIATFCPIHHGTILRAVFALEGKQYHESAVLWRNAAKKPPQSQVVCRWLSLAISLVSRAVPFRRSAK